MVSGRGKRQPQAMDNEVSIRLAATRGRMMSSLERTIVSLHTVIRLNNELAVLPGHEASARQRIAEAQQELVDAESELAALRSEGVVPRPR